MICKRCGKPIKSKSLKCGSCGEKHTLSECSEFEYEAIVKRPSITESEAGIKTVEKKKIALISGIAAAVVACVAIFCVMHFGGENDDTSGGRIIPTKTAEEEKEEKIEPKSNMKFFILGDAYSDLNADSEEGAREILKISAGAFRFKADDIDKEFGECQHENIEGVQQYVFPQKNAEGRCVIVSVYEIPDEDGNVRKKILVSGNYDSNGRKLDMPMKIYGEYVVGEGAEKNVEEALAEVNKKPSDTPKKESEKEQKPVQSVPKNENDAESEGRTNENPEENDNSSNKGMSDGFVGDPQSNSEEDVEVRAKQAPNAQKVVIYPGKREGVRFKSIVVSNELFNALQQNDDYDINEKELLNVYKMAVCSLTEDATYDDFMNAILYVAEAYGKAEVFYSSGRGECKVFELIGELEPYNKTGYSKVVVEDDQNGVYDEKDYDVKIYECGEDFEIKGKVDEFEVGEFYCVKLNEEKSDPKQKENAYVYCTEEQSTVLFHKNLELGNDGDEE